MVVEERLAHAGFALALVDVLEILVPEVLQRAEHRVGGCLTEGAERRIRDGLSENLECVEVRFAPFTGGDALEDRERLPQAFPAWRALPA